MLQGLKYHDLAARVGWKKCSRKEMAEVFSDTALIFSYYAARRGSCGGDLHACGLVYCLVSLRLLHYASDTAAQNSAAVNWRA